MKTLKDIKDWKEMKNQVICGDCLECMKLIPDKSIDLVLTDFPYGVGFEYDNFNDTQENLKELIAKAMPEILRIGKRVAITCGTKNIYLYPKPDWVLCWHCASGTGMSNWGFCTWQPILVYGKDPYLENRKGSMPDSFSHIETRNKIEKDNHPCAKPIDIWRKILIRCSLEGLICDPFMGSWTTARACKDLGRDFIGFEISEDYCKVGEERLRQEILF
jgi:site-specific DNA-methyltransferase (adenine-specific)